MKYDAIVIGSGNGGLVSALTLQKKGKKVLLLEQNNVPGGLASSFKRGRFEFDVNLGTVGLYGSNSNPGSLKKLFDFLGLDVEMKELDEALHVITLNDSCEYSFPIGIDNFIQKMEEYVPGSRKSMEMFFALGKECLEAITYICKSKDVDISLITEKYREFLAYSCYSVNDALKILNMPIKARELLSSYWLYFGSSSYDVSFVHYASMVYSFVVDKPVIPLKKSYGISLSLYEEFVKCGGVGKFLTEVIHINVVDNHVKSVVTNDKNEYFADVIICDMSLENVYGKLILDSNVCKEARQLTNARVLGGQGVCVYLGLNKSPSELGLKHYSYYVCHTLDSKKEFLRMKNLKSDNLVGFVLDNGSSSTVLCLFSAMFSNCFTKCVNNDNYFELKDAIAENLIAVFEKAVNCHIKEYIEEIEIATPLTFARYTNAPNGVIYGYFAKKSDNLLPRLLNMRNENFTDGLYFTGGFGCMLSGYAESYFSGYLVASMALEKMRVDKDGEN